MPTVVSHAVAAIALITAFPERKVPRRFLLLGAVCSMAPDTDVLGFRFGIQYSDLLGHRGFTHSIIFAALLALVALLAAAAGVRAPAHRGLIWMYLFLATASHGFLDAFTDGGLGVAFFAPFDTTRYFFPKTPIAVSPIGAGFFSMRGLAVLLSELKWVWLPSIAFAAVTLVIRRLISRHAQNHQQTAS